MQIYGHMHGRGELLSFVGDCIADLLEVSMKLWQVIANGEGFVRSGEVASFELAAFIEADSPTDAFVKACDIARQAHPELAQATGPFPRAVINAEEIQETIWHEQSGQVELHWICAGSDELSPRNRDSSRL